MLQAVFIFYALPYFTDNALRFDNIWAASILIVSINTGAYMAAADRGRGQRKAERVEHAVQVHRVVFVPQNPDVLHELGELIHGVVSFHF